MCRIREVRVYNVNLHSDPHWTRVVPGSHPYIGLPGGTLLPESEHLIPLQRSPDSQRQSPAGSLQILVRLRNLEAVLKALTVFVGHLVYLDIARRELLDAAQPKSGSRCVPRMDFDSPCAGKASPDFGQRSAPQTTPAKCGTNVELRHLGDGFLLDLSNQDKPGTGSFGDNEEWMASRLLPVEREIRVSRRVGWPYRKLPIGAELRQVRVEKTIERGAVRAINTAQFNRLRSGHLRPPTSRLLSGRTCRR